MEEFLENQGLLKVTKACLTKVDMYRYGYMCPDFPWPIHEAFRSGERRCQQCGSGSSVHKWIDHTYIWPWVKTYGTIFGWMNIHLPTILMFTRGTRFWPITISESTVIHSSQVDRSWLSIVIHSWVISQVIFISPGNISGSCFDSQSQGIQILLQWVRPQRLDQFHFFLCFPKDFGINLQCQPGHCHPFWLQLTHSGWISEQFFRISGGRKDHPCGKRGGHSVVGGGARGPACALGMLGEDFHGDWSFSMVTGSALAMSVYCNITRHELKPKISWVESSIGYIFIVGNWAGAWKTIIHSSKIDD